ncbi:peptidoglycan editing factor PgeF [Aliiglaciecola sp. CAU 1673]|uniref:peptidoglycan editing factor PgeF n=1 Tax=Aliiglaciecola sp. CAU 1673 TaxID=3032595 RepID=UPI0023DACA6C|nr:peptidoglycan editing factor PgeF [Aliiglaciecola sp. CAU 1673]MDF2178200.1 peptidoglycan editing factor PgeF [Aliiglaciecola sp. CAU 1673]
MKQIGTESLIIPDWPAPKAVKAFSTLRTGGVSFGPYESLNLGAHVGDNVDAVARNRGLLPENQQIIWLNQVHGNQAVELKPGERAEPAADASFTRDNHVSCAVMTADCLPVLLCHKDALAVAAVHCGWRGLASSILEETLAKLPGKPVDYLAWLGPAIGPQAFKVGEDVKAAFPEDSAAFSPLPAAGKYLADIYQLAKARLARLGLMDIYGGQFCTFTEKEKFFSYRRDGQTGRMASVIWLESRA